MLWQPQLFISDNNNNSFSSEEKLLKITKHPTAIWGEETEKEVSDCNYLQAMVQNSNLIILWK